MLRGIDVSHYQEEIDWARVKASGVRFAILKASEGTGDVDPMFEVNFRGAVDAGILPGTYHFFLPRLDAVKQAAHYLETIAAVVGKHACLPPCMDIETPGLTRVEMNNAVRTFMQQVSADGRGGMIYTSFGFWTTYLPAPVLSGSRLKFADVEWALDYPLWLAHYTSGMPYQVYPWSGWTFWQFSSGGKIAGVPSRVDLDLFNGSEGDLAALAGGGA
jgi:lysozyme